MIGILVRNMARVGERRNHQRGNSGAVPEEIKRLDVTRIIVSSAFIERYDDGGAVPQLGVGVDAIDDLFHETFEKIKLGRGRVAIEPAIRLHERNRRQSSLLDGFVKRDSVLQV